MPVYGAAKPVSATDATVNGKRIALSGQGFQQGSGSTGVDVVRVGAAAGRHVRHAAHLPARPGRRVRHARSEQAGDLQYVGRRQHRRLAVVRSEHVRRLGEGRHHLIPFVDYDTTGDGEPDYETNVQTCPPATSCSP